MNNITQIACNESSTIFLNSFGNVYSCGYNDKGQLGLGDITNSYTPTQIPNLNNITQIACGGSNGDGDSYYSIFLHSLFLNSTGQVYSCGSNFYGQLGHENNNDLKIPTLIPNLTNIEKIFSGYATTSMFLRYEYQT